MGSLWMLVAGFMFGCMGVFVKLGSVYFSHVELVFYRSIFGLFMVYLILRQQHISVSTRHWRNHLLRGVSGSISLSLYFYCVTVLPLVTAVTLNYTAPLFLTLFSIFIFKEKFHLPLALAIALGFCGVVLLLHPTLQHDQLLPGMLGLFSGFLAGIAYFNVKQLGQIGEPEARTVFYFSLTASMGSGAWMVFGHVHAFTLQNFAILVGLGISATLGQLAMTRAYRLGKTLVVGSMAYSTIIFSSFFGIIIWDEALPLMGWIGLALIITGGVISLKLAPKHEVQSTTRERK